MAKRIRKNMSMATKVAIIKDITLSKINVILGIVGLFLTSNGRLSKIICPASALEVDELADIIGLNADDVADDRYWGESVAPYRDWTVLKDIQSGRLWVLNI